MEGDSKKHLTMNVHMGLFLCNRLVFGIVPSAPAIINQALEGTFDDSFILDDMIVPGRDDEEHLANV